MRLHGRSFFVAVLAAFILTPRPVTANAIIQTVSATDEQTPDTTSVLPPDNVAEPNAPLFTSSDNMTQSNLEPVDSSDEGFLSPELLSLEPGSFPAQLHGTEGILDAVPEPFSTPWISCGLLAIAWIGGRKRT